LTSSTRPAADSQRIQRALEVWQLSGQPLSSLHTGRSETPSAWARSGLLLSLEPGSRAWLHRHIGERFAAMLAAGLVDEVKRLRARGDLHPDLPSMRCVGYRQSWEMLDGLWPAAELLERGSAATRQLAKRQLTWLRSMPRREVLVCDAPDLIERVLRRADAWRTGRP
jgi:tRNA dimethylallyltransferase